MASLKLQEEINSQQLKSHKKIETRMHDELFKKHILDYLQRIIYNGERKCFITRIFLSEYRALNIIYHFEKNHT